MGHYRTGIATACRTGIGQVPPVRNRRRPICGLRLLMKPTVTTGSHRVGQQRTFTAQFQPPLPLLVLATHNPPAWQPHILAGHVRAVLANKVPMALDVLLRCPRTWLLKCREFFAVLDAAHAEGDPQLPCICFLLLAHVADSAARRIRELLEARDLTGPVFVRQIGPRVSRALSIHRCLLLENPELGERPDAVVRCLRGAGRSTSRNAS